MLNQTTRMFGLALLILTLITGTILAFMAGPTSPLTLVLIAILVMIPFVHKKLTSKNYVKWHDSYSVGIASIDQQHKKLINLINQLQTAVEYSTGEEFEREALNELVAYTKTHFSFEENLMEENGYPDFEAHKAQHVSMIAKVEEVLAKYSSNQHAAMNDAVEFLKDWLIHHINGTDKEYTEFLNAKGVK